MAAYTITSTDPVVSAFVAAYRDEYGEDPNNPAGYAFDAFTFAMQALEETNCEGREAVKEWFTTQMVDKKGVTGTITLFERERGFAPGMYTAIEVRDGKWQEVTD
jgi:branched-chain amino acid transport system substrate-binding protein